MGVNPGLINTYYTLCGLSVVLNALVVVAIIFHFGFRTDPMKLVLYLHVTLTLETLLTFPKIFVNSGFCDVVGFFRTYFGLANYVAVFILVLHYRIILKQGWRRVRAVILSYREQLIFLFPLITVFAFINRSFGGYDDDWCELHTKFGADRLWALLVYYGWIFLLSFLSIFVLAITCYSVYKAHPKLMSSMFKSCGLYVVLAILSWIPRLFSFVDFIAQEVTYLFLYVFAIGYVIVFLTRMKSLGEFERTSVGVTSDCDSYFCWELGISDSMHTASMFSASDRPTNFSFASRTPQITGATVQLNPIIINSHDSSIASSNASSARSSGAGISFGTPSSMTTSVTSGGTSHTERVHIDAIGAVRYSSSLSQAISSARQSRMERNSQAHSTQHPGSTSPSSRASDLPQDLTTIEDVDL